MSALDVHALYSGVSVTTMRRVIGVASAAAQTGRPVTHSQIDAIHAFVPPRAKVVVLSDWDALGVLPSIPGRYVYDLSDAGLLAREGVRNVLAQCAGVLVPSAAIARRAQLVNPSVRLVPSSVHLDWLLGPTTSRPPVPVIGCFGAFAWEQVAAALRAVVTTTAAVVATNVPRLLAELPAGRVQAVDPDILTWPHLIRGVRMVLLPGVEAHADPGIAREAMLFGARVLASPCYRKEVPGSVNVPPQQWEAAIREELRESGPSRVARLGAREYARSFSAPRVVLPWMQALEKLAALPLG